MKNTLIAALILSAGLSLASCKSTQSGDPKEVARNFFEAMQMLDWDKAAEYATKDSKSMIDLMKMGASMAGQTNMDSLRKEVAKRTVEYSDPVIDGDMATITVNVDGDKTDFRMKKEEGKWKVAFDKNSMMQTGLEKARQGMDDGGESLQDAIRMFDEEVNQDSLKKVMEKAGEVLKDAGDKLQEKAREQ